MNFVVKYVKDLVSGISLVKGEKTSDDDIRLLVEYALDMRYVRANNGVSYWYYVVEKRFVDASKKLLRQNGVRVSYHQSYLYSDVLRVSRKHLDKKQKAKDFIKELMEQREIWEKNYAVSVRSK